MRLTKYEPQENSMFPYQLQEDELRNRLTAIHKLGQLEDIEDELGIDLLTLFKALKDGVWIKEEYSSEIRKHDVRGVFNGGIIVISKICSYPECDFSEYSCDYGKTWALTKEELECIGMNKHYI